MDIFVIEACSAEHVDNDLLNKFQNKKFSDINKQRVHSFSYLMLDRILREHYQIEDREIVFKNKKPFLKNDKKQFSISHSYDYIVISFSDHLCGVDIEKIIERDYKAIAKRMKLSCSDLKSFYDEWTKFEANYKLGAVASSMERFELENYIITAVSENSDEKFELYIQK